MVNTLKSRKFDISELKGLKGEELEGRIKALEESRTNTDCDVKVVASEEGFVSLSRLGYNCQVIEVNKWLMK